MDLHGRICVMSAKVRRERMVMESVNGATISRGVVASQPHQAPKANSRLYLPTLADLVDRLVITQQKSIFIHEHREEYDAEIALIMHDIDVILEEENALRDRRFTSKDIRATIVVALANREIWLNETKARRGGSEQDGLLKFTHSVNGVRNTAKNAIAASFGERKDYKVDCFAAELIPDFGNWNVF